MPKVMSNMEFLLFFLLNSLLIYATVTEAWSPGSLLRLGRGPRLRPVPTNLCVLAGRPRKSSSVQQPEDFDEDGNLTRQQEDLRSMLEHQQQEEDPYGGESLSLSSTASPSFSSDVYEKKVDLTSAAPQYFTPDPLESDDLRSGDADIDGNNSFLNVAQLNLPTRIAQPGLGLQHHHRAVKSLVHERFGRQQRIQDNSSKNYKDPRTRLVSKKPQWKRLKEHVAEIKQTHLRDLLQDEDRSQAMFAEHDGVYLDYSRQQATSRTMKLLRNLAKTQRLEERIQDMVTGKKINFTEKRAVLHTALRAERSEEIFVDGVNTVEEVHQVLDQIKYFTEGVRNGDILGYTGKRLRNIISVGIGGSYLGPEFLHEVLKTEPEGINSALGYNLRFLANVDPIDVERTCADLDPEETLIVVVSKTFTTAETMLNARAMRQWLWDFMGNDKEVVRKHIVACASISSIEKVQEFGIDTENYFFRFWDWVGGRYSVCSAVGAVPISLMYGYDLFEQFLKGAQSIDEHFRTAPMDKNIPVIMGLLGVWNHSFLGYKTRTTLPYAEALLRLPSHIQQLDMESNGKVMTKHGIEVDYDVGEIDFGEPGTNGQHSFFQLLHMGQIAPCDFIGFCQSQHDLCLDNESLSSHDELMSNFFAQPDALANGKTEEEVRAEGIEEELIPHRVFKGNRPSMSLLMPKLTAYAAGQLLAIYEHRTAVQGFIWDINSFDQWGVELGKKLANDVKGQLVEARKAGDGNHVIKASNPASSRILKYYVENSPANICYGHDNKGNDVNPMTRITRKTHEDHCRASSSVTPPTQHDLGGNRGRL